MPFMYSEMQNKLSKTRESPLESMGQIISSRCPETSQLHFLVDSTTSAKKSIRTKGLNPRSDSALP